MNDVSEDGEPQASGIESQMACGEYSCSNLTW